MTALPDRPLVVGAGPVGLAAALLLARAGVVPRVIEKRRDRSRHSRALAVNPRTLEILSSSGVTARLLEIGAPIPAARFHRGGRVVAEVSFGSLRGEHRFLLALSQSTTERVLEEALRAAGGEVERGLELVDCWTAARSAEAELEAVADGSSSHEHVRTSLLVAADGAHSVVRERLGIAFPGEELRSEWHLVDAPLRTQLDESCAHVLLEDEGEFLFLLRVVDDELEDRPGERLWRVLGNRPDPLSRLQRAEATGAPVWSSSFRVGHRVADELAAGAAVLAGDAAHVHSPIGARGMNLGIEDAWVVARLWRAGRLEEYGRLRRAVDARVVRRVEALSRVAAAETTARRLARRFVLPLAARVPPTRGRLLAMLAGLDHPLPLPDERAADVARA